MRPAVAVPAVALLVLAACARTPTPAPAPPPPAALEAAAVATSARQSPLVAELPPALVGAKSVLTAQEVTTLFAFYEARGFAPVWFDGGGYAPWRERFAAALAPNVAGLATAETASRARREVALSVAATRVAAAPDAFPPEARTLAAAFAEAVATGAEEAVRRPAFGGHAAAITRYRTIVAAGGWPFLPPGETIEPGDAAPHLDVLRARLAASGDLMADAATDTTRYAGELVAAVQRFQARHGLAVDGVIGPATRAALNVPAEARLAQLEAAAAAAERLAERLGERYVMVNLPAFELRYVRDGEVRHRADVVVGSVADPTPAFADTIEHLVFNPYWHVPASIAREELVYDFKDDPAAMSARGYRLINSGGAVTDPTAVDWSTVDPSALPFRVRQGPGTANALGRVKFMFPNEHAIYLHDTPSRHLFERASRAFSHGCIRVRDPMALAERLLETDGWSRADIDRWVGAGTTRTVVLDRPVPVHLIYLTAWGEPDGRVQFRRDIYGRGVAPGS